jgi:hypothetical protein
MVISNMRPYQVYFTFYYEIADVLLHNYDKVVIQNHVFTLALRKLLIKAQMNKYYFFLANGKIEREALSDALDGLGVPYEILYLSDERATSWPMRSSRSGFRESS